MATIQKTTIRRYDGTDWDPLYLATSADITTLGVAKTVSTTADNAAFVKDEVLDLSTNMSDLVARIVNRMATVEADVLPKLADGSSVTALEASKITGKMTLAQLPDDVAGKGVEVATEDEKAALNNSNVNPGDIVKVTGGKVYLVTAVSTSGNTYMELTDSASAVAWSRLTGTPTTLEGYGITDAINSSEKAVAGGTAGKVAVTNEDGKLAFDIVGDATSFGGQQPSYYATKGEFDTLDEAINAANVGLAAKVGTLETEIKSINVSWIDKNSGQLPIEVIPPVALGRVHTVADRASMSAVTINDVQNGDTVKIADTPASGTPGQPDYTAPVPGAMFFVIDDTKLGTAEWEQAFMEYATGKAAAVEWGGVLNTPTTLAGYGITDAVNATSDVVTDGTVESSKGKLVKVGEDGKLKVNITGDAMTLGGKAADYFATKSEHDTLAGVVGDDTKGLVKGLADVNTTIGNADTEGTIMHDLAQLKSGAAVSEVAASKITGTLTRAQLPADISGRTHEYADMATVYTSLTATNASVGDLVLAGGKLYSIIDVSKLNVADGYKLLVDVSGASIAWSQLTGTPTTLEGYGITDAVNVADVVEDGLVESSKGKLVKVGTDGKMAVNISGDAATLGGNAPSHYATASSVAEVSLRAPMMVNNIGEVTDPVNGQLVLVPVSNA